MPLTQEEIRQRNRVFGDFTNMNKQINQRKIRYYSQKNTRKSNVFSRISSTDARGKKGLGWNYPDRNYCRQDKDLNYHPDL